MATRNPQHGQLQIAQVMPSGVAPSASSSLILKWRDCVGISKALSSKPYLAQWQGPQTRQLEEWGRIAQVGEDVWPLSERLQQSRPDVYRVLEEVLDVIAQQLKEIDNKPSFNPRWDHGAQARGKPPTLKQSVSDDRSRRRHVKTRRRHRPKSHSARFTRAPRSDLSSVSWSGCPQDEDALSIAQSYASEISDQTIETMSSRPSQGSATLDPLESSKKMVEAFTGKLFELTETVLKPELCLPELKYADPKDAESRYRDIAYNQTYRTLSKLVPRAAQFIWHRISYATAPRLWELHKGRDRLLSLLQDSTYFAGKYVRTNQNLSWAFLGKFGSQPSIPGAVEPADGARAPTRPVRKHATFPLLQPRRVDQTRLSKDLCGVGTAHDDPGRPDQPAERPRSASFSAFGERGRAAIVAPSQLFSATPVYVCFVEACVTPYHLYDTAEAWAEHLNTHPELMDRPSWTCTAWSHVSQGYPRFYAIEDFQLHMYDFHKQSFGGDQNLLLHITETCYQAPILDATCPICLDDWDDEGSDDDMDKSEQPLHSPSPDEKSLVAHVQSHLEQLTPRIFASLPACGDGGPSATPSIFLESSESSKPVASEIGDNRWILETLGPFHTSLKDIEPLTDHAVAK